MAPDPDQEYQEFVFEGEPTIRLDTSQWIRPAVFATELFVSGRTESNR
jgi:hypothetical protein